MAGHENAPTTPQAGGPGKRSAGPRAGGVPHEKTGGTPPFNKMGVTIAPIHSETVSTSSRKSSHV